jgi:histidinol dehydrogenase
MSAFAIIDWATLDESARDRTLARPTTTVADEVRSQAAAIIAAVRRDGDTAIRRFTQEFDGVDRAVEPVSRAAFARARALLAPEAIAALERAIANVEAFHAAQRSGPLAIDTLPGVRCERVVRPIGAVGLYVPAGSAPLPSAVVMLAVPARLAGCPTRILCSSPDREGSVHPAILVAAELCAVDTVFAIGGAQAIAAMAYGTTTVPKVDKVFGPGNAWVTAAKQVVASDPAGAAIDLPAGPSEVLVIADASARPDFVAADLLAQAEHGPDSQAVLLTDSAPLARAVASALATQMPQLSRREILDRSTQSLRLIVTADIASAVSIANRYAPEHLILEVREPRRWLGDIDSAGSIFLGAWSPEPMGDYCSGTNHVLPTGGYARAASGLGLADFQKRITVQELTPEGLAALGPTASTLARLEGLDAHAAAVDLRLEALRARAAS